MSGHLGFSEQFLYKEHYQFNIGQFIATIHGTNINLEVPQYKNC